MKTIFNFCALLFVGVLLAGCSKNSSSRGYEVTAFAFQEEEDGKWGLMDMDGKVLVKPKFRGDVSVVIGDRFTVTDENNELTTLYTAEEKPQKIGTYQKVGIFSGKACPVRDKNGVIRFIDKDGNDAFDMKTVSKKKVISAYSFFNGRAMIHIETNKWGFIDESGEPVIPIKYADAWNFSDGVAVVYLSLPDESSNAKWAVIDTDGNELFTKKFKDMTPDSYNYVDGLLQVSDKNDRHLLIDKKGETVKKFKEGQNISEVHGNLIAFYDTDKEYFGLMNMEGEMILKEKYESVNFNGKLLTASVENERSYLFDLNGEKICKLPKGFVFLFEPEYKNYGDRFLVGKWEEGYELLNGKGEKIDTEADIFAYGLNSQWGFDLDDEFYEEEYGD